MRMLLNENMPNTVVSELRQRGHDVLYAKESMRGESDRIILARAQLEQRLVVTQDKDFGELAFRFRLPASCGIVLFRLSGENPEQVNRRMMESIDRGMNWIGYFSVITERQVRIRPLPAS